MLWFLVVRIVIAAGASSSAVAQLGGGGWHDRHFNVDWSLTARSDEVIVVFAASADEATRNTIAALDGLESAKPFDNKLRTAVYRTRPTDNALTVASRLKQSVHVSQAVPAVVDQFGLTRYYVPGLVTIQLDRSLTDAACRQQLRR
jgi:hypothetical protein